MNLLLQSRLLCCLSAVLLFVCCKKDTTPPGVEAGSGKITFTLDGKSWESKDETGGAVFGGTMGTNLIQGYATDDSYLGLTLIGDLSTGLTLETSSGHFQATYKPSFSGTEQYTAVGGLGTGSITVTSYSATKIIATFQFTAEKTNADGSTTELVVTDGNLSIDL